MFFGSCMNQLFRLHLPPPLCQRNSRSRTATPKVHLRYIDINNCIFSEKISTPVKLLQQSISAALHYKHMNRFLKEHLKTISCPLKATIQPIYSIDIETLVNSKCSTKNMVSHKFDNHGISAVTSRIVTSWTVTSWMVTS